MLVLVSFQNCAPQNSGVTGSTNVRIVDRFNTEKVSFPVTIYYVDQNVESINIDGLCDQSDGEVHSVQWRAVKKNAGQELDVDSGLSNCQGGGFKVALASVRNELSDCSAQVEVQASLDLQNSEPARAYLRKQCF